GLLALKLYAWKLRNPLIKPGTNLSIIGLQGIGKELAVIQPLQQIKGPQAVPKITSMEKYEEKFNGWKEEAQFIVMDETATTMSTQKQFKSFKSDTDSSALTLIRKMYK